RISTLGFLPYKDLWTLYGPRQSLLVPFAKLIFGRSLLGHRMINIVMLEAVVLLVYLLCRRLVPPWSAAVFASAVGLITIPLSYVMTFLFLVPGLYLAFFPHELNPPGDFGRRREIAGMVLIGFAFLGRIDYGLLALWAVAVFIFFSRRSGATPAHVVMI